MLRKMTDSKKYNNIKLASGIFEGIAGFILLLLFVSLGYSKLLEQLLTGYIHNNYLLFLAYIACIAVASAVVFSPLGFYTSFYLEHKYNLSNQTFGAYLWENTKGIMVGTVIGVPLLLLFYYVMNVFGNLWWLPFATIMFLVSVVLARIAPVVIMPLFFKVTPIDNIELKERITLLAAKAGVKVENVFKFDMSKDTKKANAAFTGLGKSKRILLGDTLLDGFTTDEIETVIGHELGHYKHKHIIKNIIIGTAASFLTLFLIACLYRISLPVFGFNSILQISALPLIALWGTVISLIETPLTNMLSRKYEYQADEYAVTETKKPAAFINTLNKLTDQNLGDKDPHPFVEWYYYSHPSIKKRIAAIVNFCKINNILFEENYREENNIKE